MSASLWFPMTPGNRRHGICFNTLQGSQRTSRCVLPARMGSHSRSRLVEGARAAGRSEPAQASIGPAVARPALDALASIAKPSQASILREGMEPEAYVDAFLQAFGASGAAARIWRDPSGHAIVISDQLFRDGRGNLKIMFNGRNAHAARLAEVVMDPDEIWLDWGVDAAGRARLVRATYEPRPTALNTLRSLGAVPAGPERRPSARSAAQR